VRLHGQEAFILIHIENQSKHESDFPKRMFHYFALLHKKHDLPVFPIAIFSYERPLTPATDTYSIELFRLPILRFHFQTIQLNRLNWRDFLCRPNPVASALMAKMKIAPDDRPRVKLECPRMMLTLKYDPARTELISRFMNSYLRLTAAEAVVYTQDVEILYPQQKETFMRYHNEWEREGSIKERIKVIGKLLRRRLGDIPPGVQEQIGLLTDDQVDSFIDAMEGFREMADAQAWLSKIEYQEPVW
jgi:hypothetical protein